MWISIHKYMKTTLGISLYSYLYLKLQKHYVFLIISHVFSSTKSEKRVEQVLYGSRVWGLRGRQRNLRKGEVVLTTYIQVSKCKNDKIKERKKKVNIIHNHVSHNNLINNKLVH
jgi:hypothetical protein